MPTTTPPPTASPPRPLPATCPRTGPGCHNRCKPPAPPPTTAHSTTRRPPVLDPHIGQQTPVPVPPHRLNTHALSHQALRIVRSLRAKTLLRPARMHRLRRIYVQQPDRLLLPAAEPHRQRIPVRHPHHDAPFPTALRARTLRRRGHSRSGPRPLRAGYPRRRRRNRSRTRSACCGRRRRLHIPAAVPLPAECEANDHPEQYERQYQDDVSDKFQRLSLRISPASLLYKPSCLCARLSSSIGSTLYISYGPPSVSCVRGAGRRIQASGRCGPDDIAPPPGQSSKRPNQRLLGFREMLERTESMPSRARQRMVIARQREYKRRNEKRTDSADM